MISEETFLLLAEKCSAFLVNMNNLLLRSDYDLNKLPVK